MGDAVSRCTPIAGTLLVLSLNPLIVLQTFGVAIPGLSGAG